MSESVAWQTEATVLAEEAVESPLSTPARPMLFHRVRKLLLGSGEEVYGCTECGLVRDSVAKVRSHVSWHHNPDRRQRQARTAHWRDITLGDAVELAQQVERLAAEVATWKRRAKAAETDLDTIKRVMGGVRQ